MLMIRSVVEVGENVSSLLPKMRNSAEKRIRKKFDEQKFFMILEVGGGGQRDRPPSIRHEALTESVGVFSIAHDF